MLPRTTLCIYSRILPRRYDILKRRFHGSMYITNHTGNVAIKINSHHKILRYSPILGSSFIRSISNDGLLSTNQSINYQSTLTSATDNTVENNTVNAAPADLLDQIPDAPSSPTPEIFDVVAPLAEPTFTSLGLGGYSPPAIIRQILEALHVSCDISWWGSIIIATVAVRTLMLPLVIIQMRNVAHMSNHFPGMQKIQMKISEAKLNGDQFQVALYTNELTQYIQKHKCNPFKSMIVPLAQAPIFLSFYQALKAMTALPVESMTYGGLYWFKDLTVCDPYCVLPALTSVTVAIILKCGIDGPKMASLGMFRYVFHALPFVLFPISMYFPAAVVWYWLSTNIVSINQVLILKIPKIRKYFGIPDQITHPPDVLPAKKNFVEGFKESMNNIKMAREMVDRQQLDLMQFNKAGRGPIPKTYAYNPRKVGVKQPQ